MTGTPKRIAIIGAMDLEIVKLDAHVTDKQIHKFGEVFVVTTGKLLGRDVVYAATNVGMVFASSLTTLLISQFNAQAVIFTGVCGGLKENVNVGDVVIVRRSINYDMNCTGLHFPHDPTFAHKRGQLPFLNWHEYEADPTLYNLAVASSHASHTTFHKDGLLVTGSEFVTNDRKNALKDLWLEIGDPHAVEMECAAVAQISRAFRVPFVALQAVSDSVNGNACDDFNAFCAEAANNTWPLICHIVENLSL
eukprot:c21654_g1_i1.p1 GENE.c21654_g1_i1~~c21654_g1_i1.p1  ORF type:complete len:262 (-),score=56.85 c21654_g1_i1:55-804(-)